ncbi:MAG: type III pantothenate kinase [Bacteroidota bacterium]|nr:type III pantothenate kinase [Bacteroidota bacterium]MDX5430056.1 type III pantothenate kinase [Bacteroidota bacterium]MDX5468826.1 type III pantothenate kinase [Bacteroidota bacterium]
MINGIIDIGNSSVKFGVFENHQLMKSGKCAFGDWTPIQELAKAYPDAQWMMSTVQEAPSTSELGIQYQLLDVRERLPVTIAYATPSTLGKDRIAAVCGAWSLFPGIPCLVIDAGTCITFDFIDAQGVYHGGSISPGLHMRLKAMHQFTGKLPELSWEEPEGFIGNSTQTSMLQGVKQGLIGEVLHQVELYKKEYSGLKVLITGGDAPFFEKNLKIDIFAAPNLVLIGLNTLLLHKQSLDA